jgi:biopolymer transport protein ExbD
LIRRRQRRTQRLEAFEGINITPFTDVLLVLLIIFMIAGSALAPTGLSLSGLASQGEQAQGQVSERPEVTVEIDAGVATTRLLYQQQTLSWLQLERLPDSTPVTLSIDPRASAERIIEDYDRLLDLGFTEIQWGPPRRASDET